MGEHSKIEWCHHTWNPWVGCTKLSPACDFCYAEGWAKRTGQPHLWAGERRRTSAQNWQLPLKWDRAAAAAGERYRIFCGSLMDFADNQVPTRWRDDAWHRIDQTRHLDWMLLSKRPENYLKMLPRKDTGAPDWGDGWQNVWVGTTIEDRDRLRRIDHLRAVPARIRFLSIEPLLEDLGTIDLSGIHLVIVGGESGPRARPMHPDWARSLRDQCASNNVPFFFKQWGEWRPSGAWIDGALEPGSHGVSLTGDVARAGDLMCGNVSGDEWNGYAIIRRVGKVRAGRLLDSREFSGMPDAR